MFDIGFFELLIIFVIGLLVLGPERLPRVAAKVGNWVGQARRMTRNLKYQLEDELALQQRKEAAEKFVAEIDAEIKGEAQAGDSPTVSSENSMADSLAGKPPSQANASPTETSTAETPAATDTATTPAK